MDDKNPSELLLKNQDIMKPALDMLRKAFVEVVNEKADPSIFRKAVEELDNARRFINGTENIGFVVAFGSYIILPFRLTGDPKKDLGQSTDF
jgi:hypothetical protein